MGNNTYINKKRTKELVRFLMERWTVQAHRARTAESLLLDLMDMNYFQYIRSRKKIVEYVQNIDCEEYDQIMKFLKDKKS